MNKQSIKSLKQLPNPTDYVGFVLWQKSNAWEKYVNQELKPYKITHSELLQLISLMTLDIKQDEVTQVELINITGVSPMSTSKILKSLENRELITRQVASDSRAKSLSITDKGYDLLIATAKVTHDATIAFFDKCNSKELLTNLKKL